MYQTQLKDGNIVISELPYELIKNNIQFHGATNCTLFWHLRPTLQRA